MRRDGRFIMLRLQTQSQPFLGKGQTTGGAVPVTPYEHLIATCQTSSHRCAIRQVPDEADSDLGWEGIKERR